jgi:hypothetical protein
MHGRDRNMYEILVRKLEGSSLFGGLVVVGRIILKMNRKEI